MESQGRTHTSSGSWVRPRTGIGEFHPSIGDVHIDLPQGGGLFFGLSSGLEFRAALVTKIRRVAQLAPTLQRFRASSTLYGTCIGESSPLCFFGVFS